MNNQSSKKNIIIISAIVIIALVGIFYFMGGTPVPTDDSLLSSDSGANNQVGTRVLSLLNQIESLRIDTSLFTGAAYQTLVDYSVDIPPQDVGRPNPFAPLPGVRLDGATR
jgi:flagellar basal body-associated protein FliL